MKIFVSSLLHETLAPNTLLTSKDDFNRTYLKYDGMHEGATNYWMTPAYHWRELSKEQNHVYVESLAALANPSGPITGELFKEFADQIVKDLKKHHTEIEPVDFILLNLHGAMVSLSDDDCEGVLLAKIREVVGTDVKIGVLMDLHAHHTPQKEQLADVIVYYHEYPHIDLKIRAEELFNIMIKTVAKKIEPKLLSFETNILNHMLTVREPMQSIVRFMEQQVDSALGIEMISIAHGFPWSDVPKTGVIPLIVYNNLVSNAKNYANELAEVLGLVLYALREETKPQVLTLTEVMTKISLLQSSYPNKPIVLADYPDNPGGGALGSSTFALEFFLKKQIPSVALSSIWDKAAVKLALEKGLNQEIILDLGGSHTEDQLPYYGNPLKIKGKILGLDSDFKDEFAGGYTDKGKTVRLQILSFFDGKKWLDQNDVDVIINELRDQTFSPKCFTAFNIDITKKAILIVKSMYHYQDAFSKITDPSCLLTLNVSGRLAPDFKKISYHKLSVSNMWPILPQIKENESRLQQLVHEENPTLLKMINFLEQRLGYGWVEKNFNQYKSNALII